MGRARTRPCSITSIFHSMKKRKTVQKKIQIILVATLISVSSIFSFGFVDNYFEMSKNLDIFATLFRELNIYYVDDTNPGDLMKTGIDAMLETLDPYTNYIPESDIEDYRFMTTGMYGGIGALIRKKEEHVVIAEPYEDFPAHKSGLMAGDIILQVNDESAKGKTTSEMSKILKGQSGTTIKLLIKRTGEKEPFEVELTREEIKIKDVPYSGMLTDGVGYIKLTSFTETASKEVINAYKDLKEKNDLKSLILDLRGNGGGLLREAVNIVNVFVEKGQEIVRTKGKVMDWDKIHKALNNPIDTEIPLVVLMDNNSASASEIVSGAIQDLDRGVIVGQKSFGKGLVQQTRNLSYNAKLKVTVAKYYIPSGRCIQKLDYSHREKNKKAAQIPDSLIADFKTKNGRTVHDGEGIMPDLLIDKEAPGNITISLRNKMHLFDFATKYRREHPTIVAAGEFKLSNKEYQDFVAFLEGKDYEYTTRSEKMLEELEEAAMEEKYYDDIEEEYTELKNKMQHNKESDLFTFQDEITKMLENEIISRYYYQKGRIEASLAADPDIEKAIEALENKEMYASILKGTYKPEEQETED